MSVHVTDHAIERYLERVEHCPWEDARARLERATKSAAAFGCRVVKLGCGSRVVLEGDRVVTVYPRGDRPRQIKG